MKSKEEIEQLAEKSAEDVKKDHADYRFREVYKEFYIDGYTQCQEDMTKDVEYWQGEFDHWYKQAMDMAEYVAEKKYTEEDLHNLLRARRQLYSHTDESVLKVFINSLNKQD